MYDGILQRTLVDGVDILSAQFEPQGLHFILIQSFEELWQPHALPGMRGDGKWQYKYGNQ
jgi:hypothetical protein